MSLEDVMSKFNLGQIILLSHISKCNADDMDRDMGGNVSRGTQMNTSNREAAELFAGGL